eukprot:4444148-Ditylum_brightwellii.AAC.1
MVNNDTKGQSDIDLSTELREQYPKAEEGLDDKVHTPLFKGLGITAYMDRQIIFIGRTPVMYQSKQQGAVETSTYGAEFMAMKTMVKEEFVLGVHICAMVI